MLAMQGASDSSGHPIDREFYRTFWGLQAVFQQPYSIIEPSAWAAATGSIHRVLAEFRKQVQYYLSRSLPFLAISRLGRRISVSRQQNNFACSRMSQVLCACCAVASGRAHYGCAGFQL